MKITPPNITPGPWRVTPDGVEPERPTWSTPYIAAIDERGTRDAFERAANTKAIAALPTILDELVFAVEALSNANDGGRFENRIRHAKAALTAAGYTITP